MSWKVTSRNSVDLSQYTFLPFGRFNEAMPFLTDFINSGEVSSDLIAFDTSNVGKLQRAIIKLSKVEVTLRNTGKKVEKGRNKGKAIMVPVYDRATVEKASIALGITLETIANENSDGKLVRQFVTLNKVAA